MRGYFYVEDIVSHGVLSDGSTYETSLWRDRLVGREADVGQFGEDQSFVEGGEEERAREKWWIKASLGDGQYLASFAKGWNVVNRVIKVQDSQ